MDLSFVIIRGVEIGFFNLHSDLSIAKRTIPADISVFYLISINVSGTKTNRSDYEHS